MSKAVSEALDITKILGVSVFTKDAMRQDKRVWNKYAELSQGKGVCIKGNLSQTLQTSLKATDEIPTIGILGHCAMGDNAEWQCSYTAYNPQQLVAEVITLLGANSIKQENIPSMYIYLLGCFSGGCELNNIAPFEKSFAYAFAKEWGSKVSSPSMVFGFQRPLGCLSGNICALEMQIVDNQVIPDPNNNTVEDISKIIKAIKTR